MNRKYKKETNDVELKELKPEILVSSESVYNSADEQEEEAHLDDLEDKDSNSDEPRANDPLLSHQERIQNHQDETPNDTTLYENEAGETSSLFDNEKRTNERVVKAVNFEDDHVDIEAQEPENTEENEEGEKEKKNKRITNYLSSQNQYLRLLKPTSIKFVFLIIVLVLLLVLVGLPQCIFTLEYDQVS
jgi:hypothetical protein